MRRRVAPGKGGRDIVMELVRGITTTLYFTTAAFAVCYWGGAVAAGVRAAARIGMGKAAVLRCPAESTERTPKATLSLETSSLIVVAWPALTKVVQVGSSVARQTTS